ncbi:hypothetical protein [Levilactobacillus andaensis]|uniref:hypothetical protein n=1 Tax=Levilactobacillus andaensis TaxID=2799570 RepID=UPI0019408D06|nr:hypothetical protein [Levilactobacillus andaensis]
MTMENHSVNSSVKMVSFLWAVCLFLQSQSVFYTEYNGNFKKAFYIFVGFLIALTLLTIVINSYGNITRLVNISKYTLFMVLGMGSIFLGMVISSTLPSKRDIITYFVLIVIFFMWSLLLKNLKNPLLLLNYFKNLVAGYAVVSIVLWLLCSVFSLVGSGTQLSINWGGVHSVPVYFHLYAQSQSPIQFFGVNFVRNTGIFSEAPMYSFVLSTALLVELAIKHSNKLIKYILMFTIITTASTTGVILVVGIVFFEAIKQILKSRYKNILMPFLIVVVILGLLTVEYILQSKFSEGMDSISVRQDDFKAGFITWRENLIFGVGMSNDLGIIQNMNPARWNIGGNTGFSSGIMKSLAGGGIIMTVLYYLFPMIRATIYFIKNKSLQWIIPVGIVYIFTFTIIYNLYIFIFLLGWMWAISTGDRHYEKRIDYMY